MFKWLTAAVLTFLNCCFFLALGLWSVYLFLSSQDVTCQPSGQTVTIHSSPSYALFDGLIALAAIAANLFVYFRKPNYAALAICGVAVVSVLGAGVIVMTLFAAAAGSSLGCLGPVF